MGYYFLRNTIICSFGWFIGSELLKKKYDIEFINKTCSNTHAIITFTTSSLKLLKFVSMKEYYGYMSLTVSYAIFDIYFVFKNNFKMKYQMLLHHSIIICSNILLFNYYYGNELLLNIMAYNYLSEFTTIPLNLSLYMYEKNLHTKKNYKNTYKKLNETTLLGFFVFRIINGLNLIRIVNRYNYYIYGLQLLLTSMNFFWFYKLSKYYIKTYLKENIE